MQCFHKERAEELYDYELDNDKKFIKFFKDYVIEIKNDKQKDKDTIAIYDFKNKLSMHTESYNLIK